MKRTGSPGSAVVFLMVAAVIIFLGSVAVAQEHPEKKEPKSTTVQEPPKEHPTQEAAQEHPEEHPVQMSTAAVTKENLAEAIQTYVATQSEKNKGMFVCKDDKTGESLKLTLKKIHKERLSSLGDDTYFACADFTAADGKVYDLDIFMKGKTADGLTATEVAVHKEDGVERYTWSEVEGTWKKTPVEKEEKKGKKE